MKIEDCTFAPCKGKGPGGQRKNKKRTACRAVHRPTGTVVFVDTRYYETSKRKAIAELRKRVQQIKLDSQAAKRKNRRDEAIKPQTAIRTYDFKSGVVINHVNGKRAPLKEVMGKGRIELLR